MKTLQELALEQTIKNTTSKKSSKNMNDRLLEVLLNKELDKENVIAEITLARLQEVSETEINQSSFKDEDFVKDFNKMMTTVKNGFESSWCQGQNNASFHYNEKYKNYEFKKVKNNVYTIVKK